MFQIESELRKLRNTGIHTNEITSVPRVELEQREMSTDETLNPDLEEGIDNTKIF